MEPIWVVDTNKSTLDTNRSLFPHQQEAVKALTQYFNIPNNGVAEHNRGLLIMPTGSGKTFTAVQWLFTEAMAKGYKIIWLVHRRELIDQASAEFMRSSPVMALYDYDKVKGIAVSSQHYPVSSARGFDITVGSSLSVGSRSGLKYVYSALMGKKGKEKLIVVIDEAHHAVSNTNKKILAKIQKHNPNFLLLGLTATPTRLSDAEKRELSYMFNVEFNRQTKTGTTNGYIYECKLKDLIVAGFLATPVFKRVETNLIAEIDFDFDDEQREWLERHGELSDYVIKKVTSSTWRNNIIVDEYLKNQNKYGKTIVFAVNQFHAKTLAELFRQKGITCEYCISDEPESKANIDAFKQNKFKVLINVQMMTEGSDVPDIQTVFLTRATQSDSLLMQMIGRGLRGPDAGGTEKAYIVDFHDNWGKYQGWLDPRAILFGMFDEDDEFWEMILDESDNDPENLQLVEKEEASEVLLEEDFPDFDSLNDRIWKIYEAMQVSASVFEHKDVVPYGWFSLPNDSEDDRVLIYDAEADGYDAIAADSQILFSKKPTIDWVAKQYFDTEDSTPDSDSLGIVLDVLYETGKMPRFFTFKERELVDIGLIAENMSNEGIQIKEISRYASYLFEKTPLLQSLHKDVGTFTRRLRSAALRDPSEIDTAKIEIIDERADFKIEKDYYDLNKMMDEILSQFADKEEFAGKSRRVSIRWSKKPWRSKFGYCKRVIENEEYEIVMNLLLSSPLVAEEVVASVVHHELLHAYGFWNHDKTFRHYEWKYNNKDLMNVELDTMFQDYDLDKFAPPRPRRVNLKDLESEI